MYGTGLSQDPSAQPFLKWAGGKRQLMAEIDRLMPEGVRTGEVTRYIEPMVGGGAVFFHLVQRYPIKEFFISDYNWDLFVAFRVIKTRLPALLRELQEFADEYLPLSHDDRATVFYRVRDEYNQERPGLKYTKKGGFRKRMQDAWARRAAQTIFLNRTCFNGLYRVNSNGDFNVPHGRYDNPPIRDESNLRAVRRALREVTVDCGSYEICGDWVGPGSFVYFDPPYRPLPNTPSFTAYSESSDFGDEDQRTLARFFEEVTEAGALAMLSNSDPKNTDPDDEFFDRLYADFNIHRVSAIRAISSDGGGRGAITEIIVTNYPEAENGA